MVDYDSNNVFALMLRKELNPPPRVVYEDDLVFAFHDHKPKAPVAILVIPKFPCVDFSDFMEKTKAEDVAKFFHKVREIAQKYTNGHFKVLTNNGSKVGQEVFHFHIHIRGELPS